MRYVIKNVLPLSQIKRLRDIALHSKTRLGEVSLTGDMKKAIVDKDYRKVYVSERTLAPSVASFLEGRILGSLPPEFFDASLIHFPNVWEYFFYSTGCFYHYHGDAHDNVKGQHIRVAPRAITVILALSGSDEYAGGEFMFKNTGHQVLEQGDLLLFSSETQSNDHCVLPVKSGNRVVLSNWGLHRG